MARLPQPGGDSGSWGDILNDYLAQSHKADGALKDNSVGASQLQTGSVAETTLTSAVQTKLNQPATIADGSVTKTKLTTSVQTTLDKADSALQTAPVTTVNTRTGDVTITKTDVGLGAVDNTADTAKPVSTAQQTALDLKADTSALSAKLNTADLDTQTAAKITDNTSATAGALSATFAPRWKSSTAYALGDVVLAPDGSIVERTVAGTSGASYSSANWKAATGFTNAVKAQTQARIQASGASNPPGVVHIIGDTGYVDPTAGTAGVFGGGHALYENVIGGVTSTVNTAATNVPATPPTFTTAPSWSFIWGGYDNVVNGWACQVQGYHCKVEAEANHCTIGGGSGHTVAAASLYGTIAGGTGSDVAGSGATVGGGSTNHATGTQSTVSGGLTNTASGSQATIGGGTANTSTASGSTVAGGRTNDATNSDATIGGGILNDATGAQSTVAGGSTGLAGGQYSAVGGGLSNTASGVGATVAGGRNNIASGDYSVASGRGASANVPGMRAHASSFFTAAGDAQACEWVGRKSTTNATASIIFIDGLGTDVLIPVSTAIAFDATIVAREDATGSTAAINIKGLVKRGASGASSLVGTPTTTVIAADAAASAWTVTVAGHASGFLRFTATGEAAKTIRWVLAAKGASVSG